MTDETIYSLRPVGVVRSELASVEQAPLQGPEGAPEAWVEIDPAFADALSGVGKGDEVILLTWLHLSRRDVQKVHPRSDPGNPLTGVFGTRSPDRPNPVGLHRVRVIEAELLRLRVWPLEAIDGTPVIDIKPVLTTSLEA
jgi:tRNA-Thr(GGU) m(6)t(6)A37 methyltransferase TsaA